MESNKKRLSQKRLKELMDYDPKTGNFVRKVAIGRHGRHKKGAYPGFKDHGYLRCEIDGSQYYCHRLAWLFVHGYFPENGLDHINKDRSDNRIENLREVSQQCNIRNTGNKPTNKSGVRGVCWDKQAQKWRAVICINYKSITLGVYREIDEAICTRLAAEQCVGWVGCDSNSPAYQYVKKIQKQYKKYEGIDL